MTSPIRELRLDTISVEQTERVLIARFDDAPYNFMTARLQNDLDALTRAVDADPTVGAVVFTGGIEQRYITHFDIAELLAAAESNTRPLSQTALASLMRGMEAVGGLPGAGQLLERSPLGALLNVTRLNQVVLRIMRSPAVYIAAIGGPCGGGGLELSVCFDVRLAANDDAVGFILPELLIGLNTTVGGQRLAQLIGPARALEMLLEGRMYSAREAVQMGLVSRLVSSGNLIDEAQQLGARYARRNRDTIAAQKKIFNNDYFRAPSDSLRQEGAANAAAVSSGPAPQALRAWLDKQRAGNGDSVFLTDLQPWIRGDVVDLNP
jgi:enoyl-CoA hydratase